MRTEVVGADGTRIGVRTAGDPGACAMVFVHGWAQSSRVWDEQFADPELRRSFHLAAMDLRGHGESGVPAGGYDDPRVWADDLDAVLDLVGDGAVLVGWSYGGLVITDYVRRYGTRRLAGIVLIGAITEIGRGHPGGRIGAAMRTALPDVLDEDLDVALPALAGLIRKMSAGPLPGQVVQSLLGASLAVPPPVRSALFRRDVGSADVLAAIDVPTLILHGTDDAVVDISAGRYAAGKIPGADSRWWVNVGHLPFIERAQELNTTLLQFAEERTQDSRTER